MDDFGDRMKMYENQESGRRFIPTLPVYARIDGRAFSKFTKGMARPYDAAMTTAMIETTKYLVEETNAKLGYTQSDEISLVWHSPDIKSEIFFGGRVQKMTSQLAALASVKFLELAQNIWPEKVKHRLPTFDARVFTLPNQVEAANCFVWREMDATKNSVSMAAQHYFSHKQLQGKGRTAMMDMLMLEKCINWNDYPAFFKRGTYVARRPHTIQLTEEQLEKIPANRRPEGGWVQRNRVEIIDLPPITRVQNRTGFIFNDEPLIFKD